MKLIPDFSSYRILLKHSLLPLFLVTALGSVSAFAQGPKKNTKSKLNTQIFEAESDQLSFSGKVRIVRDIATETEVFFEDKKNPGPFLLPDSLPSYGLYKARLEKSKKSGGPFVKVVIDNDRIKSVEIDETQDRSPSNEKAVIDSLFKK